VEDFGEGGSDLDDDADIHFAGVDPYAGAFENTLTISSK
jgi:hypothetical protein